MKRTFRIRKAKDGLPQPYAVPLRRLAVAGGFVFGLVRWLGFWSHRPAASPHPDPLPQGGEGMARRPEAVLSRPCEPNYLNEAHGLKSWFFTTDHKRIGI